MPLHQKNIPGLIPGQKRSFGVTFDVTEHYINAAAIFNKTFCGLQSLDFRSVSQEQSWAVK